MKIVMFSMGPVFRDCVHGGSQRMLCAIAKHLGGEGHTVRIFCTQRPDNAEVFELAPQVTVSPTLRFKCHYPEPYYTAPYNLSGVICDLLEAGHKADVFYVHDGELAYPLVYGHLPTVISFRDLVYPDTLSCGLGFERDSLIVASEFMRRSVIDLLGRYRSGIAERVVTIKNGVDLSHFYARTPATFPVDVPRNALVLLCPHRPDSRKGFSLALRLLQRLVHSNIVAGRTPLLLIPRWVDSRVSKDEAHEYQSLYRTLTEEAQELGVLENVRIHEWINDGLMPSYYSQADLVLCIGTFIEAFGNVQLEAAACGVPSIVATVGANIGKLPPPFSYEVPPDDLDAAFDAACLALTNKVHWPDSRQFLLEHYSMATMLAAYSTHITNQKIKAPLPIRLVDPFKEVVPLRQPAWCRVVPGGVYNDYAYGVSHLPELIALYRPGILPAHSTMLASRGFSYATLRNLIALGYLTFP